MRNRFYIPGLLFLILALSVPAIILAQQRRSARRATSPGPDRAGTVNASGKAPATAPLIKNDLAEALSIIQSNYIDGKKLDTPVQFQSSAMPLIDKLPNLKVGDNFHCAGYETGEFRGTVKGAFKYEPSVADLGYHFHTHFVVLSEK